MFYICIAIKFYQSKTNKMKYILQLCLCLSIPLSIQAQAILEHTYPTTDLHRIHWTFGGEHYWFSNDSLKEIKVYSAQHQLQKTIRYPSVLNSQVRLLKSEQAVTQTTINTDNLLEMVWFLKDTLTKKEQVRIINERDSVVLVFNSAVNNIEFNEIEGLRTKLFVTTFEGNLGEYITKVYGLPSLNLENTYFRAYRLHRKKFGYAGEKYFYKDSKVKRMQIYNANHSYWKSVNLAWFPSISLDDFDTYTDADDNLFTKDSLVEVTFSYASGQNYRQAILAENSFTPIHSSSYDFRIDHQNGLTDKFFILGVYNNGDSYSRLYSLPLRLELESPYSMSRTRLKKYGETVSRFTYPNQLGLVYINSANNKTIQLPQTNLYSIVYPYFSFSKNDFPFVNDSIINKDSLIEIIYIERNNNGNYLIKIVNDTGRIYNTIDSTHYFSINQSPTLSPKLITKTGNDKPYNTKVWRFNKTTLIKEPPSVLEAKIYPNPFSKSITIETQENTVFPLNIRLMNALGEVVLITKTDHPKIDLALPNLAKGVYFLELSDNNKRTVREIVKMDF